MVYMIYSTWYRKIGIPPQPMVSEIRLSWALGPRMQDPCVSVVFVAPMME